MAKGKTAGSVSLTRRTYLYKLASEIITGQPAESYGNSYMDRGKSMEDEARDMYAFQFDAEPQIVGFARNGRAGASPDSLIGDDAGLEIKTKAGHLLIEVMFRDPDDMPPEHRAQVQGSMWICERERWDLACYWPGMPLVTFRIKRDNGYIANLAGEVARFNDDLDAVVERVRSYGRPAQVAA